MAKQIVSKAIGIDLGTTNSVVAIMDATDANIIIHRDPNTKGETTPSCVWKDPKTEQVVVGRKAYSRIGTTPKPIRSIKRLMGTQEKKKMTNEEVLPEEVSAKILNEMKRQIEEDVARLTTDSTDWIIDRAIITVPAYFDQPQIEATRIAGEMAGLQVLELLHEPTAAACYHCWETKTQNGLFLVYDLGGGTFDVSILRCTEGEFEVLGIGGNKRLGGDDFDTLLAEDLQERLIRQDYDLRLDMSNEEDILRFDKLKLLAEGVKKALSNVTEFVLRDTATLQDRSGERVDIDITFERQEFEALIRSTIERTLPYCDDALKQAEQKAGVTLADIDEVILVGGSTHIPLVQEMVRQHFCADPNTRELRAKCSEPVYNKVDTMVALGAAIRASAIGGVEIYNPERTARVSFRGVGVTSARQTYTGGQVESLHPEIHFTGGSARLTIPNMNYEDEQDLKDNGTFSFTRIPLQSSSANLLTFEFHDSRGTLVAKIDRIITQNMEVQRPTGGSTGTAILSKALFLDINQDGKVERVELLKALDTIPTVRYYTFFHPGDTDYVKLPLYQNRKKIKEIDIKTGLKPQNTPVKLTITIDKLANITVEGNIAGDKFQVDVQRAADRTIPTAKEVQDLHQQFINAIAYLPTGKRAVAEAQYRRVKLSYEAAIKREDLEQAIHEFEEMEELVAGISQRKQTLQPAKAAFDKLVSECKEYNVQASQLSKHLDQPHDYKEMAKTIEAQRLQGEQSYANENQSMYSDAIEMLQAIQNHLTMLIQRAMSIIDTRSETDKATDYLNYVSREATGVEQSASPLDYERQAQIKQIRQELDQLKQEIQHNPLEARFKIAQNQARLEQIQNQLASSEIHPDIEGLVKDRYN
ncbi:MAG TPA: Hsp70 family protein [Ktedonobacteraceae bacterium]|nr:Hsp70 family protein [Ktedonobacteraceae bacterium]